VIGSSALLAWVIVSKLALHLPLERLARDLAWQGDPLAPSTLATWFARGGEAVKPLYDALLRALASEGVLQTDGTVTHQRHPEAPEHGIGDMERGGLPCPCASSSMSRMPVTASKPPRRAA
jgi:hypothetical protein